ncbi:MAG: hypothetical protein P1U89_15885 [Verrucomicrobiales bacterium]|nr:hypothetical protein [Verrucomicrobiales bacterium]
MVSEKAEKILGINAAEASKEDISVAFWLKTEAIDRKIIDTTEDEALKSLLAEKDELLEARALLEGISLQQVHKELLEKQKSSSINPLILIFAVVAWVIVIAIVIFAALR